MFNFHMHSCVSFDTDSSALDIALAAKKLASLKFVLPTIRITAAIPGRMDF